jgi:hypothetical protein
MESDKGELMKDEYGRHVMHYINEQGYYISTLFLTDQEKEMRSGLIDVEPPALSAHQLARWVNNAWVIVTRSPLPVTVDGTTLSVPPGTQYAVMLQGAATPLAEGVAETGVLEFELVAGHTYDVQLSNFPYYDAEVVLST